MNKYRVIVRRIVREDTVIHIEAKNQQEARELAETDATSVPQDQWDTYDCDYSSDDPPEDITNNN